MRCVVCCVLSEVRHAGIPLIVGLLVSLVSGVVCLLLHLVTLAGILGWTAASLLIVMDNGYFLVYYRTWLYLIALGAALWVTYTRPLQAARLTTAASGALILVLGVDSYAHRSFGALIFQNTFLEYPMGLESAVARCFTWRCWVLLPLWIGLTVLGFANQFYTEQLSLYEQSWPLLFQKRVPANFSVTRRVGRSPPEAAAENLVAEDRNYGVSNYASYDSFLKIQTKQQAAAQQQAQQAAASAALHTRIQPAAASQELGSAHEDDKQALPPAQRAAFNFIELKKLPPSQHYLYLVVHHAFTNLAAAFGFQADNVNNQYEHLLFLLSNYQSAERSPLSANSGATATAGTEGGYQSGAVPAAAPAAAPVPVSSGPNTDAISQLHTRVFSNYREWIKYMNLGGNNTLGGSAISSDVVPLVRSQISEARVDKNTTDAKIEEICLWLLVWGEGGSLRHTPECLVYLFHNLSCENRRAHARYGGGMLFDDVASSCTTPAHPTPNARPRRAPGDFLLQVVKPLYDVMVVENSRALGVGRNYDDLNEFFWRVEALQYYYADVKYRAADPGPSSRAPGAGGVMRDLEDPPALRSSTSIAQALRVSPLKSYLEKRSWLHPLRSFMRLISFYGVCFHILVCIAYIHYAHLPLLGEASNKILSSFVLSLAAYSLLKEALELWATYGIISDSVWNGIGFLMRSAIKLTALLAMGVCYVWSWGNAESDPALAAQYWNAYLLLALIYLAPQALTILTQLFPTLGSKLTNLRLPFADELIKFWSARTRTTHALHAAFVSPSSLSFSSPRVCTQVRVSTVTRRPSFLFMYRKITSRFGVPRDPMDIRAQQYLGGCLPKAQQQRTLPLLSSHFSPHPSSFFPWLHFRFALVCC